MTGKQEMVAIGGFFEGDKSVLKLEQEWLPTKYTTISPLSTPETGELHSVWVVLRSFKWNGIWLPALKLCLCLALTRIGAVQPSSGEAVCFPDQQRKRV